MSEAVTSDATAAAAREPDVASLHHLCRVLAEAAEAVGEAAAHASELALGGPAGGGARLPAPARRALLRALTHAGGLGWAWRGRGLLARAGWLVGVFTSRESLAVSLAVTGLKARIRAAAVSHPELLDHGAAAKVLRAIEADRQTEAAGHFRRLMTERGAEYALAVLAPSFTDLLAWNALTDENPFNDRAGWQIATGRPLTSEPLLGVAAPVWSRLDRGPGRAEPHRPDAALRERVDTSGTITGYVRNIGLIGTGGLLLVQPVTGPDGVRRYVVQLAGMAPGKPNHDSPQDLIGAIDAVGAAETPYTRAVTKALRQTVPSGAELALVGHSQGGITAMNLAGSRDFTAVYTVTHVVAIGSPIDHKRPADPATRVFSLVNEHDIVPSLEGRSAVSPYGLPAGFTEFTWTDDTHAFPLCHAAERYAHNLRHDVPDVAARVDKELAAYRGRPAAARFFTLHDR
ncbi:hypothetical protein [Streptomyces sp. NRRL S-87]|uniref:hypothetical protein n=1 Tax=Streptomyces sp. NRRL S-87 TaxID=1463920 RepID=UPI0004C0F5B8|nr:hypothetical protein [Streptomyces sp. NRRL S-87]